MITSSTEDHGTTNLRANESSYIQPSVENSILITEPTVTVEESSEDSHKQGVNGELNCVSMKCLWSISSKGCLFQGVDPKDVCALRVAKMFFITHATPSESFVIAVWNAQMGTPVYWYDSDEKTQCIYHHPHHDLKSCCPVSTSKKWQDILKGIECRNKLGKTDGIWAHFADAHLNSWWGKVFWYS